MNPRPLSVTIVSWYIIVTSALGLFYATRLCVEFARETGPFLEGSGAVSPLHSSQFLVVATSIVVGFICGIYLLLGAAWARSLFILATAGGLVYTAFLVGMSGELVARCVIFIVISVILFRPPANVFFSRRKKETLPL